MMREFSLNDINFVFYCEALDEFLLFEGVNFLGDNLWVIGEDSLFDSSARNNKFVEDNDWILVCQL